MQKIVLALLLAVLLASVGCSIVYVEGLYQMDTVCPIDGKFGYDNPMTDSLHWFKNVVDDNYGFGK